MKKILAICCFLTAFGITYAQIGVTGAYSSIYASNWEESFQEEYFTTKNFLKTGTSVGINYWFRLKKKRLEFFPTLTYANYAAHSDLKRVIEQDEELLEATFLGFHLDTRLYFLDFGNDCDCPTFSKQNEGFKKGLFLLLSPGIDRVSTGKDMGEKITDWQLSLGAGLGFDIGLSDFLTLTPFVSARYTPDVNGDNFFPNKVLNDDFDNVVQLVGGINVGLRFDEMRKRRSWQ